jgi:hypothetical protein
VSEPVEAAHRRETPVNRGGSQPALLERAAVKLDVRTGSLQHGKADVDCPLEEAAKILTVGVERAATVASEERNSGQLRLVDETVRLGTLDHRGCRVDADNGHSSCSRKIKPSPHRQPAVWDALR